MIGGLKLFLFFSIVCANAAPSHFTPMTYASYAGKKDTVEILKQFEDHPLEDNDNYDDENQDDETVEEEPKSKRSKITCEKCNEIFDRTCVFKRHSCHHS